MRGYEATSSNSTSHESSKETNHDNTEQDTRHASIQDADSQQNEIKELQKQLDEMQKWLLPFVARTSPQQQAQAPTQEMLPAAQRQERADGNDPDFNPSQNSDSSSKYTKIALTIAAVALLTATCATVGPLGFPMVFSILDAGLGAAIIGGGAYVAGKGILKAGEVASEKAHAAGQKVGKIGSSLANAVTKKISSPKLHR